MGTTTAAGDDELHIRKTPALNRFLFFLNDCVSQGKVDLGELEDMKCLVEQSDDKHVFHLMLSACLDDKELQTILVENGEDMFSSISQVLDDDEMERLNKEMYVDLVVELGLIEHCLCMVLTGPQLDIMRQVSKVLTKTLSQENEVAVSPQLFDVMLASYVQLSRMEDEVLRDFYRQCLTELLDKYMNPRRADVGNCDKLLTLFRLIGVALLNEEDYQNEDEISVLLNEWEIDKVTCLKNCVSTKYYETLLTTKSTLWTQKRFDQPVLKLLEAFLAKATVNSEDKNLNKEICIASQQMTLSSYLGGCAYLIQMILEKRPNVYNRDDIPTLLSCIQEFIQKKPKMKQDEVIGEIQDFFHFCEQMNKYGIRNIYKRDWTTKFLSFGVDDIMGTQEGNDIIETFIFGADYDLVVECVKKIRKADAFILDDSRKDLILRLLTQRTSRTENDNLIKVYFQDGVNDKLQLKTFDAEIHKITLRLSSIEFEKDALQLEMYELAVIRLCLQNPMRAVSKILEQSIRTQHFCALGFARPFYSLLAPAGNEEEMAEIGVLLPQTLIVRCFAKVLGYFPDYPNAIYESLSSNMELLTSQRIITESEMFLVLKYQIFKLVKASHRVSLSIVVGMISFLEDLVKLVSEKSLVDEICLFAVNLNRFFCLYTHSKTISDAMKIKTILSRILSSLFPLLELNGDKLKEKENDVEDLGLFDQGILYIRCKQFRPLVKKFYETGISDLSFKDFVQTCVLPWVLNCCDEEWDPLIDLLFNVAMSSSSKLYRVKNVGKMELLNEMLLLMYANTVESKCTDAFLHSLRFYNFAEEFLQKQFGELEWYSLFETLLTIGIEMSTVTSGKKYKPSSETVCLHHVLSLALRKIEDCVKANLKISRCNHLIKKLDRFSQLDTRCEPVRWLISSEIKHLQPSCSA